MKHNAPARGALAGIKADAQKAKESGGVYDPRGAGVAWTHNFLNQKPWHPLNFRNQARVFEAEQQSINDAKRNAEAKAQFDAEQEQMQAISYLSEQGQKEYAARQSLAFMYMKPPGLDAALSKGNEEQSAGAQAGDAQLQPSTSQPASEPQRSQQPQQEQQHGRQRKTRQDGPRSSVSNMLGAMAALHQNDKWEMKHVSSGMSCSPPRGGGDSAAANQQFLVSSSEEDDPQQQAPPLPPQPSGQEPAQPGKPSKRERKRRRLEEAKALLRQHGLPVSDDDGASADESDDQHKHDTHRHKNKRHKAEKDKDKKKKKHKHSSKE